jgi:2-oxoglutarate ferredoxin oxidoreductase subunit beta
MPTATMDSETLKPADFTSDQEIRWCPGCGDYAIIKAIQRTLADLGVRREKTVFVSGIGCAARFPYYMSTYGFHTIHGRAPAVATGLKLANPGLDVWVVTGDGDALSIGGNHTLHVLRRNVNLQICLFNNEIYGLTKGQYSPTSRQGTLSPSSPKGSLERPLSACAFALGAGARFVARSVDTLQKHLAAVLKRAHEHHGASFVEIFQNCIVFNNDAFADFTDKALASERQIYVEHGQPLLFGKERDRGLRLKPGSLQLEVVEMGENGVGVDDLLRHDERDRTLASLLVAMEPPDFPVALGVIHCDPTPAYEDQIQAGLDAACCGDLNALLRSGRTWRVDGE